jgi:hypothetical protein
VPNYERPIAYVRVVVEEPITGPALPQVTSSPASTEPSPALPNISEALETLAASLAETSASPGAATEFALTLSQESAGLTVAVRTGAMEHEERERLERRIAGELARHGLIIHQIVLTALPVDRDSPEER